MIGDDERIYLHLNEAFVGELNENAAMGYHFWFKYLYDDTSKNENQRNIINFGGFYGDRKNHDIST